jgi:preprotein translocase subunit SecG
MELLQTLVTVVHVMTCLTLIGTVLLQSGRGGGLGGGMGGAAQVFGGRGAGGALLRVTIGASVVFFVTSLVLARLSSEPQSALDLSGGSQQQSANEDPIIEEGVLPWDDKEDPTQVAPSEPSAPVNKVEPAAPAPTDAPAGSPAVEVAPVAPTAPAEVAPVAPDAAVPTPPTLPAP